MASEINQILPVAISAVAFNNQGVANQNSAASAASNGTAIALNLKNSLQITEAIATQSVGKVDAKPKQQSVRIPKKTEPNFPGESGQEDEKAKTGNATQNNYASKAKNPNSDELDIVA